MPPPSHRHAAPLLLLGCVIFGLGSLIVKFVAVGSYAIAFWRLAIAAVIFLVLARRCCQASSSPSTSPYGTKASTPSALAFPPC